MFRLDGPSTVIGVIYPFAALLLTVGLIGLASLVLIEPGTARAAGLNP